MINRGSHLENALSFENSALRQVTLDPKQALYSKKKEEEEIVG
jgi:hypothetical protein